MEELNVLYTCDNNYAPFCGVSMYSLFKNNEDIEGIRVFVVVDRVSNENLEKFNNTATFFSRELILIDGDNIKQLMKELGVPKYRGSYATHYRKFFQMFIPENIHRLLYLDADTIVCASLCNLKNIDMEGKCMGVVLDTLGGRYKKLLNFQYNEPYFNAGVTWIDVDAWRKRNYTQKLLDHIKNIRAQYCNPDQDLFNLVLRGDVKVLPLSYNFQPAHRAYSDKSYFANYPDDYYSMDEIDEARKKPIILHTYRFLGEFPWHKGNLHPDTEVFDTYLIQSEWKDYEKKKSNAGTFFMLEKLLYRCMPRSLFLWMFQKAMYQSFYKKDQKLLEQEKQII